MHGSDPFHRDRRPLAGLAILALTLTACDRTAVPLAPAPGRAGESRAAIAGDDGVAGLAVSQGTFYPLQVGNHWSYEHALTLYIVPDGGPPGPAFGQREPRERELMCIERIAGRSYFVEEHSSPVAPSWWVRYRQDGAGLYEADVSSPLPPTCAGVTGTRRFDAGAARARGDDAWAALAAKLPDPAKQRAYRAAWERLQARAAAIRQVIGSGPGAFPGAADREGVEAGEITRLQYPLHPGAQWVIRADPLVESTVEANDVLNLPVGRVPAWRIRIDWYDFGPADRVHVWYGRSGFLKLVAHLEGVATDPGGNPIGRVIADESEDLIELSLSRGRFAAP